MSTQVDERVVEMRFDNRHFENNVQTSMSTLEKLKQRLNLTGATKGLEDIDAASRKVNMSGISSAVETVSARFSAMEVMAVTALANITNSAVNAGKRMISALTIDPIKTGFQEYETQINAVQTILANTESKGTTLDDVNVALDTLNKYADKTIYNFTQMTKNIGTFTAAGVDLDTSVSAIQGIANLAAVSGSTSDQASRAMYQLSQALAAGRVSLMDWNSVVNAGMGGEVFQNALKQTSRAMAENAQNLKKMSKSQREAYAETHGYTEEQITSLMNYSGNVDEAIKKYGSFRESLTQGKWLTTDVLTETLKHFTMAAEEGSEEWESFKKSLMDSGYSEEEATKILKMANTATDAATKVKTFTQLWDTLKEAAQSGWTQTWEILIGDFEEAKEMLTNISNVVGDFLNKTAEARNNLLQGWKDEGGRTDLLDSLANTFKFLLEVIKPVTEAFREVFPALKVEQLTAITDGLKSFSEKLKLSDEASENIKETFKGVFSIASLAAKALGVVAKVVWDILSSDGMAKLVGFLLDVAGALGKFFTKINEGFSGNGIYGMLSGIVSGISGLFAAVFGNIGSFADILTDLADVVVNVANKIWDGITTVFTWIKDNIFGGGILTGLASGGIFVAASKVLDFFSDFSIVDTIKEFFGIGSGTSVIQQFKDILAGVKDSLNAFATGLKTVSLVSIAISIGILASAIKTISEIDTASTVKSLAAIGVAMTMLSVMFSSITKTLGQNGSGGVIKAGISLMLIAGALNILASAMEKMAALSMQDLMKSLVGVAGGLTALAVALKVIGSTKISLTTSVAILALATSCGILADALNKFGEMQWDEIGRGLAAMGGALVIFVAALGVLNKAGGIKSLIGSVSMVIASKSLDDIATALKKFGEMTWGEIGRGLTAMGGALSELVIALGALGAVSGFSSIFASGAIAIVTQSLDDIAVALKKFGEMQWDEIGRGLTAMGGALAELAIAVGVLGTLAGISGVIGAGTISIIVQSLDDIANALKKFGEMQWDEIGRGLSAMGGALAEIAIVSGTLGTLAGISGIIGSGSILIVVQGLGDIADALKKFGEMTWDEIAIGLVGMGGALAEVSIISGALGALAGLPALLGGGAILLAVQGLGDLADALKKFGDMSWEQVKNGLAAMGAALGETALGGLLNTFSGFGASAISEMAASLGVLSDSVKKWTDVTVPEGLSEQLGVLADGVKKFTLAGLGGGALADAAPAVGQLADGVKKWKDVTIPEGLGDKMSTLADGVKKFSFAGLGAGALADAAPALGQLADGIKKWKDVTVPENIESDLGKIANGVKKFSFAFAGGWSLSALVSPLGKLPDSIKKWKDVSVPDNVESDMKSIANGVAAFAPAFAGGWSLTAIVKPVGDLAGSIKKWAGVTLPEGIGDQLTAFATGLNTFAPADGISDLAKALNTLCASMNKFSKVDFDKISTGITKSIKASLDKSIKDVRGYNSKFKQAAKYCVEGFASSIRSNTYKAEAAARSMGKATLEAAKRALEIRSPSREFYSIGDYSGQGFVNALYDYVPVSAEAGRSMADAARVGITEASRKLNKLLISDDRLTPTIRPVLDLSDVESGANSISSMLGLGSSIGVMSNVRSIKTMMNQNGQNGNNSDVVNAIRNLGKSLGNNSGNTYQVNGVTYDSDSTVAKAIEELVRAVIIEGRV